MRDGGHVILPRFWLLCFCFSLAGYEHSAGSLPSQLWAIRHAALASRFQSIRVAGWPYCYSLSAPPIRRCLFFYADQTVDPGPFLAVGADGIAAVSPCFPALQMR
jgi:hypothetical protein